MSMNVSMDMSVRVSAQMRIKVSVRVSTCMSIYMRGLERGGVRRSGRSDVRVDRAAQGAGTWRAGMRVWFLRRSQLMRQVRRDSEPAETEIDGGGT